MAKRRSRVCDSCSQVEDTFSSGQTCATCVTAKKKVEQIEVERLRLIELGYQITGEPEEDRHGHRKWKLLSPCCSSPYEPLFINIGRQMARYGKPPCHACGSRKRIGAALAGYIEQYGADYDREELEGYTKKVRSLSEENYRVWKHVINPLDLSRGRTRDDWHLDHRVPIVWGFKNNVEPSLIAAVHNLQMLPAGENLSKGRKLLSDEEAMELLKQTPVSKMLFDVVGEDARSLVEVVSNVAHVRVVKKLVVRESEVVDSFDAVVARVRYHQGLVEKMGARKLQVREVSVEDEKKFLGKWHVQGYVKSKMAIGLWDSSRLVALMSFTTPRYKQLAADWELLRFCTCGIAVVGGASRLFKHFLKTQKIKGVVSYSLNRWGTGGLYEKLGFTLKARNESPQFLWHDDRKIRSWRASILRARDRGLSTLGGVIVGTSRIEDPGSTTWTYT